MPGQRNGVIVGLGLIAAVAFSFDLWKLELEEKKIMKADVKAKMGEVHHKC